MSKEVSIIDTSSKYINPKIIRMNCLMLSALDDRTDDVIEVAEVYYYWVLNGKDRIIKSQ